jgi:hypothetical protein
VLVISALSVLCLASRAFINMGTQMAKKAKRRKRVVWSKAEDKALRGHSHSKTPQRFPKL